MHGEVNNGWVADLFSSERNIWHDAVVTLTTPTSRGFLLFCCPRLGFCRTRFTGGETICLQVCSVIFGDVPEKFAVSLSVVRNVVMQ
jgi:hypothetical protein